MALTEQDKLILISVLATVMVSVILFELRFMRGRSKEIRHASQRKDEAYNAILTTRSVIGVIRRQGGDVGAAERLVSAAKKAMDRGDIERCTDLCEQAREELTNPSRPSGPSRGADHAQVADEAERERLERVAENILSARMVSSVNSYKGTKLSANQDDSFMSARFEMSTAREDIKKALEDGLDASHAQDLMTDAEAAFVTGNYVRALSLAVKARKAVSSEASGETIRLKSAREPVEPLDGPGAEGAPGEPTLACGKCDATIDSDDEFCPKCGTKVLRERVCGACGSKPKPSDMFCRKCGAKMD